MGFILGVVMVLQCLATAALDFASNPALIEDKNIDAEGFVNFIEDEFDDGEFIKGINWSDKLRSEVIDSLHHENSELEEKVELVDPHRHRRDVSDAKEEKEKKKKKEKEKEKEKREKDATTLEPSEDQKVLNNETRPKDQEQMIRIELPAGVHSGKNTKLLHTNDTGFVNSAEGNFPPNKTRKRTRKFPNPLRFHHEEREGTELYGGTSSHPYFRIRRDLGKPHDKERAELEKITLQFKHLPEARKKKFCRFLKRDSIKEPLQMVMALLGGIYSRRGVGCGAHWDRARGMRLSKIRNKKARQKLILNWACEDRREGKDLILRNAINSTGISLDSTDDGEKFDSWINTEFPFAKPDEPPTLDSRTKIIP